ncbi:pregnancy-associated plasma protein-A-domain-containing protein [Coprinopsis sp. MPI-PUGE-AT-0042]|nr:pregnancy-associated plasma protein-A-domain-containing protein [Coprinopsis sp. MPI-PUGE-AT-0042]
MHTFVLGLVWLLSLRSLVLVSASPAVRSRSSADLCGTSLNEDEIQKTLKAVAAFSTGFSNLSESNPSRRQAEGPLQSYTFDVVFHIVASNISYAGGWVPAEHIDRQMDLLRENYAGTGISWRHTQTLRVISPLWHERITADTTGLRFDMQNFFREGGATTLNVYTLGFSRDTVNGFSSLPVNYRQDPRVDGVAIRYTTMPGGIDPERAGGTLTHESGHWLGLRHTFEGGCDGEGDGVADTPAEAGPAFGCPTGRDSCPDQPGLDPINNFMDYTDETCRSEFTPGQVELMHAIIEAFRPNERGEREVV